MQSQALASSLDCSDEVSPSEQHDKGIVARQFVGANPVHLSEDEVIELERHIKRCNWLAQEADGRWRREGCFAARGEADRWRLLRDAAIQQLQQ